MKIKLFISVLLITAAFFINAEEKTSNKKNYILIEAESYSKEENGSIKKMEGRPGTSENICIVGWNAKGHTISWDFIIPETGAYKIVIRYAGGRAWNVYREIKIDNKIPVKSLSRITLANTGGFGREEKEWKNLLLTDNNKDIFIKLSKGKHTIKITNLGGDRDDGAANVDAIAFLNKDFDIDKIASIYNFSKPENTANSQYNKNDYNQPIEKSKQLRLTYKSILLNKEMPYRVYLPKGYSNKEKYPVLYLLHGLGGDENNWLVSIGLDQKLDELIGKGMIKPLIVVTPKIDASFGINSAMEPKIVDINFNGNNVKIAYGMYKDFICKELIPFIDANLSSSGVQENRMIGGVSMGGFAALHIAFTHPELFSKAGGHSSAINLPEFWQEEIRKMLFPDNDAVKRNHPAFIIDNKNIGNLKIFLDCGQDDGLYASNTEFFNKLKKKGINATFTTAAGGHIAGYWQSQFEKYLLFYAGK